MPSLELRRDRALSLVRRQLNSRGSPYFLLFIVLSATGLVGFLSSVVLLWAGLKSMAVRYPVCVALAYLTFLFQLYLYVLYHRNRTVKAMTHVVTDPEVVVDTAEVAADLGQVVVPDVSLASPASAQPIDPAAASVAAGEVGKKSSGWFSGFGGGGGDDAAGALVLLVIVLVVIGCLIASVVILFEAPILLAEILVDGILMAGMARRIRRANPEDWVFSVVKRTILPALLVAILFGFAGGMLQHLVPGATTMWEAMFPK